MAPCRFKAEVLGRASPFLRFQCRIYSERCVRPQWVKNGGCSVSYSSLVDVGAFAGRWMSISDATVRSYRQCGTYCEGHKHEQRGLRNGDEISPLQRGHAKCTRLNHICSQDGAYCHLAVRLSLGAVHGRGGARSRPRRARNKPQLRCSAVNIEDGTLFRTMMRSRMRSFQ